MIKNKRIKHFTIEGQIADDSFIFGHRQKMEKLLDMQMRDFGYVPHLDLDTQFSIQYNTKKEIFDFSLIAYGVYVGKKKAHEIAGISGSSYIYKKR